MAAAAVPGGAAMASPAVQQPSVPYGGGIINTDCYFRLCNANCPQWCVPAIPPPPPFFLTDDPSPSGPTLSPLVIALIGIIASALLLVTYYLLISRYCGGFDSLRRRRRTAQDGDGADEEGPGTALRGDPWQAPGAGAAAEGGGLQEWVIRSISVCRYKRGDGLVEGTDCSVCLGEFHDGESLRLLPDCLHAFHVPCIDTWLKSHNNCPLCRANIVVYTFSPPSPPTRPPPTPRLADPPPPSPDSGRGAAATIAQDPERGRGGEERGGARGGGAPVRKESLRNHSELRVLEGRREATELSEQGIRPIGQSSDAPPPPPGSPMTTEEDFPVGRNGGSVEEVGSSRGFRAEQHACKVGGAGDRVLHCVVDPAAPVKRTVAGGRFCFTGPGKVNSGSILPL